MSTPQRTHWQGVNHIALQTGNLDATIQFYRDVLGMDVMFTAPAGEMHGRHAGIRPGGSGFLHFFEVQNPQQFPPPDLQAMYWMPGALHHISFTLPDETAALALKATLDGLKIGTTPAMDQGDCVIFLFLDNNGILLEANWVTDAQRSR